VIINVKPEITQFHQSADLYFQSHLWDGASMTFNCDITKASVESLGLANITGAELEIRVFEYPINPYAEEPVMEDYLATLSTLPNDGDIVDSDPDLGIVYELTPEQASAHEITEGAIRRLFVKTRVILSDGRKSLWSDEAKWTFRWQSPV
jgi:hypothetical protein